MDFIPLPFQKKKSVMNSSVPHNVLVIFFLFKVSLAGQSSTLKDHEYRVVNNHIFLFIGVFWNLPVVVVKHLASSLTECSSDINNAFLRISVKKVFEFSVLLSSTLESILACK